MIIVTIIMIQGLPLGNIKDHTKSDAVIKKNK